MPHQLPKLPYEFTALEPVISKRTLEFHYGKHHQGYVNKLNELIKGTTFENESLLDTILNTEDEKIFNNAAQAWNHTFYWNCMTPKKTELASGLASRLQKAFGGTEKFKTEFLKSGKELFGSGWTWLVQTPGGELKIRSLSNAENPLVDGELPLLVCDVWEHAYYLDYQNDRAGYLQRFWDIINWDFVEQQSSVGLSSTPAPDSGEPAPTLQ